MRSCSHPRQSVTILALVCAGATFTIFNCLSHTSAVSTPANFIGLLICVVFAALTGVVHAGTWPAACVGAWLLADMYLATVSQPNGPFWRSAMTPIFVLLVLTLLATRFRRVSKEKFDLAESRRGRSSAQVCANLGVAALCAALLRLSATHTAAQLALAAALVEAAADTLASEIGQAFSGSRTLLLTTGQRVPAGTDGGVRLAGPISGLAGSVVVVASSAWALHFSGRAALLVWGAGISGIFFDSLLGATLERRGWLGNDAVNFLSTLFAALCAAGLAHLWHL